MIRDAWKAFLWKIRVFLLSEVRTSQQCIGQEKETGLGGRQFQASIHLNSLDAITKIDSYSKSRPNIPFTRFKTLTIV